MLSISKIVLISVLVFFLILCIYLFIIKKNVKNLHNRDIKYVKESFNYKWKPSMMYTIESYTKPILKSYKIPNVVFQTNEVKLIPHDMYNSIKSLQEHASDCSYIYYNCKECRSYIESYYPEALVSYDKLIPLAYKADLFRYIRLYLEGGIYFDSSITPVDSSVKLMGDIIKHTDEFVSVYDRPVDSILNSFIASVPRHPILKKAIDMCIYNITNELYTENDALGITGPTLLGKVAKSLGLLCKSNTIRYFTHPKEGGVITDNNKKLYYTRYNGYAENRNYFSKVPHYSKLFDEKKVYDQSPIKIKKDIKILIVTWYNDAIKDYGDMTYTLNKTYCKKYNIDCIKDDTVRLPNRKPTWERFPLLLKYYNQDYDYIIWIDADAFFYINSPDIRNIIYQHLDKNFIFSWDITPNVQAGLIIAKKNDYTKKIFEELSYNEDKYKNSLNKLYDWQDQQCLIDMIDENFMDINNNIVLLPFGELQEFTEDNKAYVLHLAGSSKEERIKIISKYI